MLYKRYRDNIQKLIDNRLELLVRGTCNKEVLEIESYNKYLEELKQIKKDLSPRHLIH